jgi:hypothetical protein
MGMERKERVLHVKIPNEKSKGVRLVRVQLPLLDDDGVLLEKVIRFIGLELKTIRSRRDTNGVTKDQLSIITHRDCIRPGKLAETKEGEKTCEELAQE